MGHETVPWGIVGRVRTVTTRNVAVPHAAETLDTRPQNSAKQCYRTLPPGRGLSSRNRACPPRWPAQLQGRLQMD